MIQFLLPLLSMLAKGGANGAKMLPGLMAKHPGVASLLGSLGGSMIGGAGMPKTVDPEKLKMLFGAQALGPETHQVFQTLMNTPGVQQAMTQAAQSGQQFANDLQSRTAGASGDSTSGIRAFTDSAARQAPAQNTAGVTAQVANNAATIAQQNLQNRMAAYMGSSDISQQMPSFQQLLGGNIANAASQLATAPSATTPGPKEGGTITSTTAPTTTPQALVAPTASPTQQLFLGRGANKLRQSGFAMGPSSAVFSGARRRGPAAYTF